MSWKHIHMSTAKAPAAPSSRICEKRKRHITWFNPPFTSNVKSNIGKRFLTLIDQHFPKNHPLHKICNRNTLKLSYSCMDNMAKKSLIMTNQHIRINVTVGSKKNAHCLISVTPRMSYMRPQF